MRSKWGPNCGTWEFYAEKKRIGQQVDALVDDALMRLKFKPEVNVLFTVEWELCP